MAQPNTTFMSPKVWSIYTPYAPSPEMSRFQPPMVPHMPLYPPSTVPTQYVVTGVDGKLSLRSSEQFFANKEYIKQKIEEQNNEELTDISGLIILNEYLLYLKRVVKIQDNSANYLGGILNFENWGNSNYGYVRISGPAVTWMKKKQLEIFKKKGNFLFDMINKFPYYIHNFEIQEYGKIIFVEGMPPAPSPLHVAAMMAEEGDIIPNAAFGKKKGTKKKKKKQKKKEKKTKTKKQKNKKTKNKKQKNKKTKKQKQKNKNKI